MTTVASRIGLLALVAMALVPATASWAENPQCTACLNQEFNACMKLLNTSSPAPTAGKPAPVEASGQSLCPQAARNECNRKGAC